jgi:broad specificity phosphatase PhoE
MTEFWLIRHGTTHSMLQGISGRSDVDLSEHGRAEAAQLARRIAHSGARAVYASPIRRARQTAELICAQLDCAPLPLPELSELDYGEWTGQPFSSLREDRAWRRFNSFRSGTIIPAGEHLLEVQARAVRALVTLQHAHPDQRVLLVTHADVVRALVLHFLGMPLDLFARLEIGPTSISSLELSPDGARVLRVNDTAHLERAGEAA